MKNIKYTNAFTLSEITGNPIQRNDIVLFSSLLCRKIIGALFIFVLWLMVMGTGQVFAQNTSHPFSSLIEKGLISEKNYFAEKEDFTMHSHSQKVLFISSYHPTFRATKAQLDGFMSVMDTMNVEVSIEFMDTKRHPNDSLQVALFRQRLAYKLKRWSKFDGVAIGDDNALLFALEEQDKLLKNMPIVFAGINDKYLALEQNNNPRITGAVEQTSMEGTIRHMIALKPEATKIYVLTDSTTTAQLDFNMLMETCALKFPHHEFVEVNMCFYSMPAYRGMLNKIPSTELVLLISGYRDRFLHHVSLDDLLHMIRQYSRAPVFHLWDHGVGDGLIGGRIVSPYIHGQTAGKLMRDIINGKPVEDIQVINQDLNINMYDWKLLEKYNLDPSVLPKDTKFINKPTNFFVFHAKAFIISGFVVLFLLLVIVYLQYRIRKKKDQAEKMMLRARAAEQADSLKSMFLANMSHEIRTPLNSIVGFSSLMVEEDVTLEERREYFELIVKNNEQLLNLVGDILDLAKLQSGTMSMKPEVFDIKEFMRKAFGTLSHLSKSSHVELILDIDDKPFYDVYFDSKRLMQVLSNFITNALKFTEKGEVRVYYRLENRGVAICVKDTGIGIAEDKQDKVFNRFEKLDNFTQGNGLGLSISAAIMSQGHGRIGFSSTESEGSTFWCWVPGSGRMEAIQEQEAQLDS